jgi:uncharacterized membrane protein
MSLKESRRKTQMMVVTALFAAIIVALQFIPIPPIAGVPITLSLVPIVLSAVLYGPIQGAVLGALMGVAIIFQIFLRPDLAGPLTMTMYTFSPFATMLLCVVKSALAGYLAGVVAKWLSSVNRTLGVVVASAICPIVNTGIFMAGVFAIFKEPLSAWVSANTESASLAAFMFAVILIGNFLPELILNIVVSPVIVRVSEIVKKSNK